MMHPLTGFRLDGRQTGNYASFAAPALVKQEILSDVGSGDEVREGTGSGDIQNAGRILNAPPFVVVRAIPRTPASDRSPGIAGTVRI